MLDSLRFTEVRVSRTCAIALGIIAFAAFSSVPARAQLLDQLKGAVGSQQSGNGGGMLGGLGGGIPSVSQASPSNTAGVLQYCLRNNYVDGGAAASVKNSLMGKIGGAGQGSNDSGFKAGNNGLLDTGNGQSYSLGGGGIKQQITNKVCGLVLQHAKSIL